VPDDSKEVDSEQKWAESDLAPFMVIAKSGGASLTAIVSQTDWTMRKREGGQ